MDSLPALNPVESPELLNQGIHYMFEWIDSFISAQDLPEGVSHFLLTHGHAVLIVLFAILSDFIVRRILVVVVRTFIKHSDNKWGHVFVTYKVFDKLAHLAPALVIYICARFIITEHLWLILWLQRAALIYMIVVIAIYLTALLKATLAIYQTHDVSHQRPIKGQLQALQIVIYFVSGIFILSTALNKTPWGLLSVLGGLTAILILIFKDAILGFVASIQLISNNMVAKGDWIEMPKFQADGDVIDVSLTTVKVQNWDKTITTIPTYSLVADSFKNWRGMERSGGRRIKRAVNIDMSSIRFCTEGDLQKFEKFEYLKDYLKDKKEEIGRANQDANVDASELVNGRRLTNLGTFRAYVVNYLKSHPKIHKGMTFLVRHLDPTSDGLPVEIYVFSSDQEWANYEEIQANIFDHILAVVPEFGLRVFQSPAGSDIQGLVKVKA
jgi:miniconductance mechanosensitive channel